MGGKPFVPDGKGSQMQEEFLDIITRWLWRSDKLIARIVDIRGGTMPEDIRQQLVHSSPPDLDIESELHRSAKIVAEYLIQVVPSPPEIDLGGNSQITGEITGIQYISSHTSKNPDNITIAYFVEYTNGITREMSSSFRLEVLPELIQALIKKIHQDVNVRVREWFWSQYGQGELNPKKWKFKKLEVFISYRSTHLEFAIQLARALGEFENSSMFLPRMDKLDLQAGNWLDQLMTLIDKSPVFMPIITKDYLSGPISRPELGQALLQSLNRPGKRIVPILLEGSPSDYLNHFIGGYQMVIAIEGLTADKLNEIARLCLGISNNPYES